MNALNNVFFEKAKRVVIKIGSGVLTTDNGLNTRVIKSVARQISALMDRRIEVVLVSSGAMASGIKKIGLPKRPADIPGRQAVAAVGQAGLMLAWEKAFEKYDKKVAQILLTQDDLNSRKRYLNARNTIYTLLSWNVVPIVNENDTVVIDEIKVGDNDNLSAMITLLMDADILINLTDIDGLYTRDPRKYADAELISKVTVIDRKIEKLAGHIPGALGTGGMLSKIKAARKVTGAGIPMIIARGEQQDIISHLFEGQSFGTFFIPGSSRLPSRKCWIAFTLTPNGSIKIDDGAKKALIERGKSLLPIGVIDVEGDFGVGACVAFYDTDNTKIGIGLVNYSASDIRKIKGLKSSQVAEKLGDKPYDEVVHRDNLAITCK